MPQRPTSLRSVTIGVIAAALVAGTTTTASAAAWDCPRGNVCFYTGPGGSGSRCLWDQNDDDWSSQPVVCSWSGTHNVKSVWNNSGRANGVIYFSVTNPDNDHDGRIGCTRRGQAGDLSGNYMVKSHRWTTGACG